MKDKKNQNKYLDITNEWLKNAKKEKKVKYATSIVIYGKKYNVNKKNKINHKNKEQLIAETIVTLFGDEITYLPDIGEEDCIRCGDFFYKGEIWDLKEIGINAKSKKRAVDNILKNSKGQSNNFILDITETKLKTDNILLQVEQIYSTFNREWIDKILILKSNKLIKIYKRNVQKNEADTLSNAEWDQPQM